MKKIIMALCLVIGLASCVDDKMYQGPPTFGDITVGGGEAITPDDAAAVTAVITALEGVESATLFYKVNGGAEQSLAMEKKTGDIFSASIPKQEDKAKVVFYIKVKGNNGKEAKSKEVEYEVGAIPVKYEDLALNELNGNDKFIEVFNKGETAIPLKDVYVEKDGKVVWTGQDGYVLKGGEYLLLYSRDVEANHSDWDQGMFFTGGLSAKKNVRVQLFSPTGASLDDFNLTGYEKQASASYARFPNGTGPWVFADASPQKENLSGGDNVPGLE